MSAGKGGRIFLREWHIDNLMYENLLERLVEELKGYFKDDLVSIVLYGSLARGEAAQWFWTNLT